MTLNSTSNELKLSDQNLRFLLILNIFLLIFLFVFIFLEIKKTIKNDIDKDGLKSNKKYRECKVDFERFNHDLVNKKEELKFTDLELIFKDLKSLFEKRGFIINWKELEKQSLDETINALAMASPFSLEEKQVLLEAENLNTRKNKIAEILSTYTFDVFNNTTLQ